MPINLKDHVVFIDRLQMDMIPLSIAQKALEEVYADCDDKLENALNMMESSFDELNKTLSDND